MEERTKTIIKSVSITLVITILVSGLVFWNLVEVRANYNQGVQDGIQFLYNDMVNSVGRCEAYPIQIENQTVNLVLVECLQEAQKE